MSSHASRFLVTGPFRPALETALAAEIGAAKKGDPGAPVVVLVGSNMLALYLRRLVAERTPLWNVHFLNFSEMARKLGLPALTARGRRPLPELADELIIRDIVGRQGAGYFRPVADLPGFARTCAASIKDLKEAGLGPGALAVGRDPKLAAFGQIFRGYEDALEKLNLCDQADVMAAAADADAVVAGSAFIAYGFYDLTGLQRRLLLALAARAKSATAMVPAVDAPAFEYARPLMQWLCENGFRARPAAPANDSPAARLFTAPTGSPLRTAAFKMLSVPGEPREVREVVRQVIEFAEQGIPFHDIGVLLRNPDTYSRLLRDAFELRGIPCFIAGGAPLDETREARALKMLAHIMLGERGGPEDFARAAVMQFIHFAPIAFEKLLGRAPNTSAWDLLTIRAGIVYGADEWTRRLDRLEARAVASGLPHHELGRLKTFIGGLITARNAVPQSGTWTEMAGALLATYEEMIKHSDACDAVCGSVRKLFELDAFGMKVGRDRLLEAVCEVLDRQRTPAAGFQRGSVYVGDLFESRGLGFRAVIIPGLVEKSFPAASRQDPILLDGERAQISRRAGNGAHLPPKSARSAEERMLFALAVSAASERAALTFSRIDVASARERVPSHFLVRLAEALTGKRQDYSSLEGAPGFVRVSMFETGGGACLDADDHDLRTMANLVDSRTPASALYLAHVSPQFERGVRVETARWQEKHFTEFDGIVSGGERNTPAEEVMSATRIEEYAACPFQYFLKHLLHLEPLEEPEAVQRLTPLDRGSLIHHVLFSAYEECFGAGRTAGAGQLPAALRRCAEAEFQRFAKTVPPLTWAIDRANILADLDRLAELDTAECAASGARPAAFETRFGMRPRGDADGEASTDRPLSLDFAGKAYRFKGKIDRIDEIGGKAARVIDYKTGAKTGKPNTLRGGQSLQLPIYILAARMLRPDRTVTGAEYWYATARGGYRRVEFDRETLDARMDDLQKIIVTAEDGIRDGIFVATPGQKQERCAHCDFKDACGVNVNVIFERKKGDPVAAPLLELAEIE